MKYVVDAVTFTDQGLLIQYTASTDVRAKGMLAATHQLHLHHKHPDYRDDMDDLQDRVQAILRNALEDFNDSDPYYGPEDDEEDDDNEKGMGWGNDERANRL